MSLANQVEQPAPLSPVVAAGAERRSFAGLATALVSGALLSKALGFAREVLMAQVLGASLAADSYRGAVAAVMIPLAFLQHEGVPGILIPMQREASTKGNAPQQLAAITIVLTLMATVLMLGVQALGAWWVGALVGGFASEAQTLTLEFVRIMALGMPASVMLNCLAAGEIALGRSRVTNVRASLLNVAMLIGIAMLALTGRFSALAWAFTISFCALGIWALWSLCREGNLVFAGITPMFVFKFGSEFLRRLSPLFAMPIVEQGHIWIERALASRLATGAIASLDYARTLTESSFPLISQPIGLEVLSGSKPSNVRAQIDAIVLPLLVLGPPATAFLFVFAHEVVQLVFQRGAFSDAAVAMTSQALRGISVGLWATTLGWVLLRILNSAGRNLLATGILVAAFAVNVAFNLIGSILLGAGGAGLLILGLGESARGCVLLVGIVLALESRGLIMFQILLGLIPACVMLLMGWQICEFFPGTIQRLLAGIAAYLLCVVLAALILVPASGYGGFSAIRRWFPFTRKT